MNYEEKYKEALERAKKMLASKRSVIVEKQALETIFPELAESEDERMRKELLDYLHTRQIIEGLTDTKVKMDWVIWLEKQGEKSQGKSITKVWKDMRLEVFAQASGNRHEPNYSYNNTKMFSLNDIDEIIEKISEQNLANSAKTCKDEPKFKVGDWVIDKQGIVHKIANVTKIVASNIYGYVIVGGGYFNDNTEGVRLWTIQDAKDGEVLSTTCDNMNEMVFIYQGIEFDTIHCYFLYSKTNDECKTFNSVCSIKSDVHPATIEQRVSLFQKMKDAGYEWNAEKKELVVK